MGSKQRRRATEISPFERRHPALQMLIITACAPVFVLCALVVFLIAYLLIKRELPPGLSSLDNVVSALAGLGLSFVGMGILVLVFCGFDGYYGHYICCEGCRWSGTIPYLKFRSGRCPKCGNTTFMYAVEVFSNTYHLDGSSNPTPSPGQHYLLRERFQIRHGNTLRNFLPWPSDIALLVPEELWKQVENVPGDSKPRPPKPATGKLPFPKPDANAWYILPKGDAKCGPFTTGGLLAYCHQHVFVPGLRVRKGADTQWCAWVNAAEVYPELASSGLLHAARFVNVPTPPRLPRTPFLMRVTSVQQMGDCVMVAGVVEGMPPVIGSRVRVTRTGGEGTIQSTTSLAQALASAESAGAEVIVLRQDAPSASTSQPYAFCLTDMPARAVARGDELRPA